MLTDIALRMIYPQDVQQLRKAHLVGLIDHSGYVCFVGMEAFGRIHKGKAGFQVGTFLNHHLLELRGKPVLVLRMRHNIQHGR